MKYAKHVRGRPGKEHKILMRLSYRNHTIFMVELPGGKTGYKMQGGKIHAKLVSARKDIDRYLKGTGL